MLNKKQHNRQQNHLVFVLQVNEVEDSFSQIYKVLIQTLKSLNLQPLCKIILPILNKLTWNPHLVRGREGGSPVLRIKHIMLKIQANKLY